MYLCPMSKQIKNQAQILRKLGIEALNPMQEQAKLAIHSVSEVLLLSPTGTGKTLAFLLPLIAELDRDCKEVQALIIAPSRELAIQIEQVIREIGAGFKTNVFYGGRNMSKDRMELSTRPAILVGTPGRIADHFDREAFPLDDIKFLVLDEFDKSLEVGFDDEMSFICESLKNVKKTVLTSATNEAPIPDFLTFNKPLVLDFLADKIQKLALKRVVSPEKDKLASLVKLLSNMGDKPGIIFCNYKDSIHRISKYLDEQGVKHGSFYGGMEQIDRERALIKFRNGTHQILIATDLAARGIDVPEISFIIHYHLPHRLAEFTHRNGRTARMHSEGTAYVLHWKDDVLPEFIDIDEVFPLEEKALPEPSPWTTLFISGGRKDKISKGDIAGLFFKQGDIQKDQLGKIELKTDCAFVAVKTKKLKVLLEKVSNSKLKKKKVRITEI